MCGQAARLGMIPAPSGNVPVARCWNARRGVRTGISDKHRGASANGARCLSGGRGSAGAILRAPDRFTRAVLCGVGVHPIRSRHCRRNGLWPGRRPRYCPSIDVRSGTWWNVASSFVALSFVVPWGTTRQNRSVRGFHRRRRLCRRLVLSRCRPVPCLATVSDRKIRSEVVAASGARNWRGRMPLA